MATLTKAEYLAKMRKPRTAEYLMTQEPIAGTTIDIRIISEDDRVAYRVAQDRVKPVKNKKGIITGFVADPDPLAKYIFLRGTVSFKGDTDEERLLNLDDIEQMGGFESPSTLEMSNAAYAWNAFLMKDRNGKPYPSGMTTDINDPRLNPVDEPEAKKDTKAAAKDTEEAAPEEADATFQADV